MDAGDYITSTLTVPEATGLTAATWVAVFPDGTTANGTGTADGTTFTAAIGPIPTAGWGLTTWTVTGPGAGVQHARWYATPAPTGWLTWPPSLADLKEDMARDGQADVNDGQLAMTLDAAIDYAAHTEYAQRYLDLGAPYTESSDSRIPPPASWLLGVIRLAGRWHIRRRSPDGMISMGEMGQSRVAGFDPDIDRMLRIGKRAPMSFA